MDNNYIEINNTIDCALNFYYTHAINDQLGRYEIYYTEDPYLIISSYYAAKKFAKYMDTIYNSSFITIYNAINSIHDQKYWYGIYYINHNNISQTAIYTIDNNQLYDNEHCQYNNIKPSLIYNQQDQDQDCCNDQNNDVIWIILLSIILGITIIFIMKLYLNLNRNQTKKKIL